MCVFYKTIYVIKPMKTIIQLMVWFICASHLLSAQKIICGTSPKGIVMHYDGPLSFKQVEIQLEGKTLAKLQARRDVKGFRKALEKATEQFPEYAQFNSIELKQITDSLGSVKSTSRLPGAYYLTTKLAFGIAFLHEKGKDNNTYTATMDGVSIPVEWDKNTGFPTAALSPHGYKSASGRIQTTWVIKPGTPVVFAKLFRKGHEEATYAPVESASTRSIAGKADTVLIVSRDTTLPKLSYYQYSIKAYDFYANASEPSLPLLADNLDNSTMPILLKFTAEENPKTSRMEIRWKVDYAQRVKSMILQRSNNSKSDFKTIVTLSNNDTLYSDDPVNPMEPVFYRLIICDIKAPRFNTPVIPAVSHAKPDVFPPQLPEIRWNGKYPEITWTISDSSARGYKVYRSESIGGKPELASSIIPFKKGKVNYTWVDTSANLLPGKTYHYTIAGQGKGYTESALTDIVTLRIPDKNPPKSPPAPFLTKIDSRTISLIWATNGGDLTKNIGFNVYRSESKNGAYIQMNKDIIINANQFNDTPQSKGDSVYYCVSAVNASGIESARSLPTGIRFNDALEAIPLLIRNEQGSVEFSWPSGNADIKQVALEYSAADTSEIKVVKTEDASKALITLSNPAQGSYRIVGTDVQGRKTRAGNW